MNTLFFWSRHQKFCLQLQTSKQCICSFCLDLLVTITFNKSCHSQFSVQFMNLVVIFALRIFNYAFRKKKNKVYRACKLLASGWLCICMLSIWFKHLYTAVSRSIKLVVLRVLGQNCWISVGWMRGNVWGGRTVGIMVLGSGSLLFPSLRWWTLWCLGGGQAFLFITHVCRKEHRRVTPGTYGSL